MESFLGHHLEIFILKLSRVDEARALRQRDLEELEQVGYVCDRGGLGGTDLERLLFADHRVELVYPGDHAVYRVLLEVEVWVVQDGHLRFGLLAFERRTRLPGV